MTRDRTFETTPKAAPAPLRPAVAPVQVVPGRPQSQRQALGNGQIWRQAQDNRAAHAGPATQSALGQAGRGRPLPTGLRSRMEQALGTPLGDVHTHTDAPAARAAQELNAKAFTHGRDIYFGAGQYQPHTPSGQTLLAHELVHTQQQQASRAQPPQTASLRVSHPRDPLERQAQAIAQRIAAGGHSPPGQITRAPQGAIARQDADPAAAPPTPAAPSADAATPPPTEAPAAPPTEPTSLLNVTTFTPNAAAIAYLESAGVGLIPVSLGGLAQGNIRVQKRDDGTYRTVDSRNRPRAVALPFTHPALAPLSQAGVQPVLALTITNNSLSGYATVAQGDAFMDNPSALLNQIQEHSTALGWVGLDISRFPRTTNALENGVLRLQVDNFQFQLAGYLSGTGNFGLANEQVTFNASATVNVPRLDPVQLTLERDEQGLLSGQVEVPVAIANFTGHLLARYGNGTVDVRGTVGYQAEKFSGTVTLLVTDRNTARNVAREHLSPDAILASADQAAGAGEAAATPQPGPRALAGFGTLNYSFTEWLTGSATVIIDNEGHITVIGEIRPQAEVELFPQRDYIYDLFTVEVRTLYGVPLVGNVFLFANIGMQALAKLGPAKIYNIVVQGTFSTDPDVLQNYSLQASLNISAFAGLRLRAEGGVGVELLGHDIKAGVGLNALAGVRGYVEATPTIGYRELADPEAGRRGEYYFNGHMEIAAQPFLGLSGDLFVELDSPWWSPAPDERWTWPLGELDYPLPGEFGIGADVDYVIGSGEFPEIQFGEVDFDSGKFMTDLMNDHVPRGAQGEQERPGEWQEGQTEGTAADPTATAQTTAPSVDPASPDRPGDEPVPASPQEAQNRMGGMEAIAQLVDRSRGQPLTEAQFTSAISDLRRRYRFSRLDAERRGEDWHIRAAMSDPVDFTVEGTEQPQGDPTVRSSGVPRDFQPGAIQYNADGRGRARRAQGWLANAHGGRAPEAQSQVSGPVNQFMEQLANAGVAATNRFDAGHLIGDRYGGSGGAENLVPMEARMNRSWFSAFEGRVNQHVVAGEAVHADVTARYDDSNPFRDLIDPGDIPPNMFERATQIFGFIPHSITFTVGTRDANGTDHTLFSGITFSPRQRITFTLGGAARHLLIGGGSPVGARQVFQANPNPDES